MINSNLAPILIFTYKRLESLKNLIESLKLNTISKYSDIYIFSDGPKTQNEEEKVSEVRVFLKTIDYFANINIIESEKNKGLARSIKEGVNFVFEKYESVIVLEDDLVLSPNFLEYMNFSLKYYKEKSEIFSISGYSFPFKKKLEDYDFDVFSTLRFWPWGWATWKNRWSLIDWSLPQKAQIEGISKIGDDVKSLISKYHNNLIDSWAIVVTVNQFILGKFTIYPLESKVNNVGFDFDSTHMFGQNTRFETTLDQKNDIMSIRFLNEDFFNVRINKLFFSKFSHFERIKYRLIKEILKVKIRLMNIV
jgi:hypothetical protein